MVVIAFGITQGLASAYALWRGGAPERIVAAMLLLAAFANWCVPAIATSFQTVFWPILVIDVILLLGLSGVAIFADRFWPSWIASCQLVSVAVHGVRAYDPELWAMAYWIIIGSIAYPMLAMLVIGVWRYQRRLPTGKEYSWTVQRHRHEGQTVPTLV